VEEPTFLMPVQRVVGGIEVQNDLRRRTVMRVEEQLHEQPLDGGAIMTDPVILRRFGLAQLHPVQRALACQSGAIRSARRKFPRQHRQHRIMA
jgi:hypothetical protein